MRRPGKAVAIASLTADELATTFPTADVSVPARSPQSGEPFDRLPADLYELRIAFDKRLIDAESAAPVPRQVVAAHQEGQRAALAELLRSRGGGDRPLGRLPLVVLSRGRDSGPAVRSVHASLAELSENSRHTVVDGAGHEIHLFQPAPVIQAIQDVLASVQTGKPVQPLHRPTKTP